MIISRRLTDKLIIARILCRKQRVRRGLSYFTMSRRRWQFRRQRIALCGASFWFACQCLFIVTAGSNNHRASLRVRLIHRCRQLHTTPWKLQTARWVTLPLEPTSCFISPASWDSASSTFIPLYSHITPRLLFLRLSISPKFHSRRNAHLFHKS